VKDLFNVASHGLTQQQREGRGSHGSCKGRQRRADEGQMLDKGAQRGQTRDRIGIPLSDCLIDSLLGMCVRRNGTHTQSNKKGSVPARPTLLSLTSGVSLQQRHNVTHAHRPPHPMDPFPHAQKDAELSDGP
jgi:hypothetical protein